ncbi:hypothetical protein ONE63_007816 [Megalurothrips usitatus]|uniref:Sclerostin domain-containing protein 1-like n=1 Tax=Megalurothrips usitatus TaxID=439358 RepID=A0AAV7XVT1_9NEOP|nr:hypothetical protein ONE63_007816 [Megalurothrips usitatus]
MPPPPLVVLLLLAVAERGGAFARGNSPEDVQDGDDDAAAKGLTGLPAGLTTLLKFRSSLPLPGSAAAARGHGQAATAAAAATTVDPNQFVKPPVFPEEESWPGSCRLRSKRYVSDGLCVSSRPVNEVVCAVSCVMNAWSKQTGTRPVAWRCSDNGWKRQRVRLLCRDGSTRSYRIRVVQTCRCVPRAHGGGGGHSAQ